MKNFLNWFKNSTKIKRWIFLIILGIVLTCIGISKILTEDKLLLKDLLLIVVTFVAGFTCFIIGIVYIQRRNLELLIEKNNINVDAAGKNTELNKLVTKNPIYERGPNIVVIGGGKGINNILRGLKNYTSNLTAIVPVSAYGRPESLSMKELKLNPTDDVKSSIIALSPNESSMNNIMNYSFKEGKFKGLSFGDIYLYVMQKYMEIL